MSWLQICKMCTKDSYVAMTIQNSTKNETLLLIALQRASNHFKLEIFRVESSRVELSRVESSRVELCFFHCHFLISFVKNATRLDSTRKIFSSTRSTRLVQGYGISRSG